MVSSLAKINLGLRILGKRSDGFHELETIFQTISVKDSLEFNVQNEKITFECSSPWCPSDSTNLVVKAAALLKQTTNSSKGCHIRLEKNIPSGAGLGGGSSNAAATLITLNHLWQTRLTNEHLFSLAAKLGSDVPFFILGKSALGTGRGEKLYPITIENNWFGVLICPEYHIDTTWAYKQFNFSLTNSFKNSKFSVFTSKSIPTTDWKTLLENDFEDIVFKQHPVLKQIKTELYDNGAFYAQMSGSGSSMFGLFETQKEAHAANSIFENRFKTFLFEPQN